MLGVGGVLRPVLYKVITNTTHTLDSWIMQYIGGTPRVGQSAVTLLTSVLEPGCSWHYPGSRSLCHLASYPLCNIQNAWTGLYWCVYIPYLMMLVLQLQCAFSALTFYLIMKGPHGWIPYVLIRASVWYTCAGYSLYCTCVWSQPHSCNTLRTQRVKPYKLASLSLYAGEVIGECVGHWQLAHDC